MGAKYLERNVNALCPDGRIVIIGMQGGIKAELNLAALLGKRVRSTQPRCEVGHSIKGRHLREVAANVWPMFETGSVVR